MPIPNSSKSFGRYVRIDIGEEVIRAKVDASDRFSYIKESFLADFRDYGSYNFRISLPVKCNGEFGYFDFFIVSGRMKEEAVLGMDFIQRFRLFEDEAQE